MIQNINTTSCVPMSYYTVIYISICGDSAVNQTICIGNIHTAHELCGGVT